MEFIISIFKKYLYIYFTVMKTSNVWSIFYTGRKVLVDLVVHM